MPDERNRPDAFDEEPEVTYEPLPQESQRKERGASSRWLAGGAVAGSVFGAGGSAIGNLRGSLDIFDPAGATGNVSEVDTEQSGAEMTPIDFDDEDISDAPGGSVAGLIHGAEAEAGGGFTLEEFEALDLPDPPDDFGQSGDDLSEDYDDDDLDVP